MEHRLNAYYEAYKKHISRKQWSIMYRLFVKSKGFRNALRDSDPRLYRMFRKYTRHLLEARELESADWHKPDDGTWGELDGFDWDVFFRKYRVTLTEMRYGVWVWSPIDGPTLADVYMLFSTHKVSSGKACEMLHVSTKWMRPRLRLLKDMGLVRKHKDPTVWWEVVGNRPEWVDATRRVAQQ